MVQLLADRNPWQTNILHNSPYNRDAGCFGCEGVNLIRSLSYIAKKTFNRIGGANVTVHHLWKVVIGQKMFLVFTKAANGFRIAFLVLGLERSQIEKCIFFLLLFEDP